MNFINILQKIISFSYCYVQTPKVLFVRIEWKE